MTEKVLRTFLEMLAQKEQQFYVSWDTADNDNPFSFEIAKNQIPNGTHEEIKESLRDAILFSLDLYKNEEHYNKGKGIISLEPNGDIHITADELIYYFEEIPNEEELLESISNLLEKPIKLGGFVFEDSKGRIAAKGEITYLLYFSLTEGEMSDIYHANYGVLKPEEEKLVNEVVAAVLPQDLRNHERVFSGGKEFVSSFGLKCSLKRTEIIIQKLEVYLAYLVEEYKKRRVLLFKGNTQIS